MGTQTDELAAYYAKKYPFTFTDDFSKPDPSLTERYKEAIAFILGWKGFLN